MNRIFVNLIKTLGILLIVVVAIVSLFLFQTRNNKVKIAFLGDSITYFGWTEPCGYVKQFVFRTRFSGIKILPIPTGIKGNTSTQMLGRFDRDVVAQKPDIVFIMAGMNDINGHFDDKEIFQKNMEKIVDIAIANNIKPVLLTITVDRENLDSKRNNRVDEYNDYLTALATKKSIQIIDVNSPLKNEIIRKDKQYNVVTKDGVHLNIKGNTLVADKIIKDFDWEMHDINIK